MAESAKQRAARERNLRRGNPRSYSRGAEGGEGSHPRAAEGDEAGKHADAPSGSSAPAEGVPRAARGGKRTVRARVWPRAAEGKKEDPPRAAEDGRGQDGGSAEGGRGAERKAAEGAPREPRPAAEGKAGFFEGLIRGLSS